MAAPTNLKGFLQVLRLSNLMTNEQFQKFVDSLRGNDTGLTSMEQLADRLVDGGFLTRFQVNQLVAGRSKGFFVGKYKILEHLGAGAMGRVYLAEHTTLQRQVALKVLPKSLDAEPATKERFLREARAVAALNHPNVVQAYDFDQADGFTFIVMEYVRGTNLHDYVQQNGRVPWPHAAWMVAQAAQGLQHAHEAGLVHRDIKPGNLLIDVNGVVKVLDMGLALFFTEKDSRSVTLAHNEQMLGTADFLAPEQAVDCHNVDIRADIYSLGCTLYYLLTGRLPFPDTTVPQKFLLHQSSFPKPVIELVPDVPPEMASVLDTMIAKKPQHRYSTPRDVIHALSPFIEGASRVSAAHSTGLTGTGTVSVQRANSVSGATRAVSALSPPQVKGPPSPPPSQRSTRRNEAVNERTMRITPPRGAARVGENEGADGSRSGEPAPETMNRRKVGTTPAPETRRRKRKNKKDNSLIYILGVSVAAGLLVVIVMISFVLSKPKDVKEIVDESKRRGFESSHNAQPTKKVTAQTEQTNTMVTNPTVLITEILYHRPENAASKKSPIDWVEVYNSGTNTEDISEWYFGNNSGESPRFREGLTIKPKETVVFLFGDLREKPFQNAWGSDIRTVTLGNWRLATDKTNLSVDERRSVTLFRKWGDVSDKVEMSDPRQWPAPVDASIQVVPRAMDHESNDVPANWQIAQLGRDGSTVSVQDGQDDKVVASPGVVVIGTSLQRFAAALILRETSGQVEVLVVASKRGKREWVLPSSALERERTPIAVASQAAEDMAGIKTMSISDGIVGEYSDSVRDLNRTMDVYAFSVASELTGWKQIAFLDRRWMTLREAAVEIKNPMLQIVIDKAQRYQALLSKDKQK